MKYCVIFKFIIPNSEYFFEISMDFDWDFHPNITDIIFFDDVEFKIEEISFCPIDAENERAINFIRCQGECPRHVNRRESSDDKIASLKYQYDDLKEHFGIRLTDQDANPYNIFESPEM